MNGIVVFQEHLHADEGFSALLGEHVPRFGSGEQVTDGALRQTEYGFAKESLTDGVLREGFLDTSDNVFGVEVVVQVELLLCDGRKDGFEWSLLGRVMWSDWWLCDEGVCDGGHPLEGTDSDGHVFRWRNHRWQDAVTDGTWGR